MFVPPSAKTAFLQQIVPEHWFEPYATADNASLHTELEPKWYHRYRRKYVGGVTETRPSRLLRHLSLMALCCCTVLLVL